jgi:hypothetical protein
MYLRLFLPLLLLHPPHRNNLCQFNLHHLLLHLCFSHHLLLHCQFPPITDHSASPLTLVQHSLDYSTDHVCPRPSLSAKGTRYDLMPGYLAPPEFSVKPAVHIFLQLIFPCPHGGWKRKRGDHLNITFACGCPLSNILCISLISNVVEPGIDYYVPLGQGVPHDSGPIQFPFDTMIPWETGIIKGIVHAHPNMQPMIAYDHWKKKCSNHVDNIPRCPNVNVSLSSGPVPKRTLRSISIIFRLFLGFIRYYRKGHHLLEHSPWLIT